jgi:DNA-3-methyladenine glycosylase II
MTPLERPHQQAEEHLTKADLRLGKLIEQVGPCRLQVKGDLFSVLIRSVVAQQISTKAAESISSRVEKLCGRSGLKPKALAKLTDEQLQSCGLSTAKRKTIRGLVEAAVDDPKFFPSLSKLTTDSEIEAKLLPLHGIGPWTVQMVLIFGLGRMDVLPIGDLGFRIGYQEWFELEEVPTPKELVSLTESWKPYRTIGTWYIWRSREGETQWG